MSAICSLLLSSYYSNNFASKIDASLNYASLALSADIMHKQTQEWFPHSRYFWNCYGKYMLQTQDNQHLQIVITYNYSRYIYYCTYVPPVSVWSSVYNGNRSSSVVGIPTLATARMHRWSLILSAHDYTTEYVSGTSNHYADCMSRLPLPGQPINRAKKVYVFVQTEELSVTASQIAKESLLKEPAVVYHYEICPTKLLASYLNNQLNSISESTTWTEYNRWVHLVGHQSNSSKNFHSALLKELHCGHLGVSRMKSLTQSHLWWPGLALILKTFVKIV